MRSVNSQNISKAVQKNSGEQGSAIVIALFVLALISVFVAIALSRTSAEAAAVGNEAAESRTFYAAQGGLEYMTRNFNKIFDSGKLSPSPLDQAKVKDPAVPGLSTTNGGIYTFEPELDQTSESTQVVLTDKAFAGLYAIRDNWRLRETVTDPNGVQVQLTRNILNNRVPIFQFGIFYDDDLELFRPPLFSFGGRVHTNRHFFLSPGNDGVYFDSRVTAVGHIVTESWRNGHNTDTYDTARFKDASGNFRLLEHDEGSVLNGSGNVLRYDPPGKCTDFTDYPGSNLNTSWQTIQSRFDGNLQNRAPELALPLKKFYKDDCSADLIEIIKRPKNAGLDMAVTASTKNEDDPTVSVAATSDNTVMRDSRYANKPGIRISFADTKRRLPGCASVGTAACGKNLMLGMPTTGSVDAVVRRMTDYKITPLNTSKFVSPATIDLPSSESTDTKGLWIKVEIVGKDEVSEDIVTQDITEEFLSLGVTELPSKLWSNPISAERCYVNNSNQVPQNRICFEGEGGTITDNGTVSNPSTNLTRTTAQTPYTYRDTRSIINLQRYDIPGRTTSDYRLSDTDLADVSGSGLGETVLNGQRFYLFTGSGGDYTKNAFVRENGESSPKTNRSVVPVPIKMFDGREGLYYDQRSKTYYPDTYYDNYKDLPINGIMSMVDIDVANLRRLLRGDFDGRFPTGTLFEQTTGSTLKSDAFTNKDGDPVMRENLGWVLYISDRRGDFDFDGEFDMEDVYGRASVIGNDGTLQNGEDVNGDKELNRRFGTEASRYRETKSAEDAATEDFHYYRRGIRLINGTVLPGEYNSAVPSKTRGFTVASENGIYIKGNYNAEGLYNTPASNANSPYDDYKPFNTATHIPASIVADGVTILSNNWNDAQSFTTALQPGSPSTARPAKDTTIRFAMIAGDTISTRGDEPNQGSTASGERTNGGVHNFKRFLEDWSADGRQRLDYAGSLINLFNSRNANGSFKCCALVYNPPKRNWVFDSTFLDPNRLPPGTPMFQYIQTTGFLRTND